MGKPRKLRAIETKLQYPTEAPLEATDDFFRILVDAVNDYAIFGLNLSGCIISWNSGAARLNGWTAGEVLGTHFSRFYTPEDVARGHPEEELKQAAVLGRYQEEGWRIKKDGSRFWAEVIITPMKSSDGKLTGYAKVTHDLTRRKEVEQKLRKEEERFRLLVSTVQDYAIFTLDPHGNILTWNVGAKRIKGYESDEIIGKHFSIFYPKEDIERGKPERELRIATEVGRYVDQDYRVRKDGSKFWADVVITPIWDANGNLYGFSKVTRDLTERKAAEDKLLQARENLELLVKERTAELTKAKDEAEQAVRMRDEFLSIASHELRTPLTSLLLYLEIFNQALKKSLAAGQESAEGNERDTVSLPMRSIKIVTKCEEQGKKLTALLNELLDLTRIRLGRIELTKTRVDLGAVVRNIVHQYQQEASKQGSTISIQGAESVIGHWDSMRIEQIASNLISNAIKYGDGKPISIIVERNETKNFARLTVRDHGKGISSEMQDKIFERFERGEVESRKISGLGLGLYICRQITQAHGGHVHVKSASDGSTFIVELPFEASK